MPAGIPFFNPKTMSTIKSHLADVLARLPQSVRLVAVSKFHPIEALQEAYDCGQRVFGESRVQELQAKHETLPKDIEWHFIGHLQQNKVKYIAPYVSLVHAVDSLRLLQEINRQALRCGRVIPCLLELHIAQEESKYGFTPEACEEMLAAGEWKELAGVQIAGLMCMASNTDDEAQIRSEFHLAHELFKRYKNLYFADKDYFKECSWGMSHDYPIAVEEGATLVRVGSYIFGERI